MTTAADVRAALTGRWPDDAHLHIAEAPDGPSRQGRKLDVLVVSLWKSRGYELDGVEIKVSVSDWRRELKEPAKADWWWKHVNRFWIAAPSDVATKIKPELPGTWGLLSINGSGVRVLVPSEKHTPTPLTWPQTVGLLRATADAGFGALNRAEQRGYNRGYERAKAEHGDGVTERRAQAALDDLRRKVEQFEQASGITLTEHWNWTNVGDAVNALLAAHRNPARVLERLDRARREMENVVTSITEASAALDLASVNGSGS